MSQKTKTIGDIPELRDSILADGQAVLDAQNDPGFCQHPVLGKGVPWDTTGSSVPPFDLHNCKGCGTSKAVRPFVFPQLVH